MIMIVSYMSRPKRWMAFFSYLIIINTCELAEDNATITILTKYTVRKVRKKTKGGVEIC